MTYPYYIIGLDSMPYVVFPDEEYAWDWQAINGGYLACCGGFMNGVSLVETIGM